jgi:serine/threonine protein kinase
MLLLLFLKWFHSIVILRDLAARNVLVREQSRQCVVSDFGMSRIVEAEDGGNTISTFGPIVTFVDNYRPDFFLLMIFLPSPMPEMDES